MVYLEVEVINKGGLPFALVVGIVDRGDFPGSTPWGHLTCWVGNLRSLPLSVHFLIPGENSSVLPHFIAMNITTQSLKWTILQIF